MTLTAIIGAGMAGLACARTLQDAGLSVVVFDKGRGPGGRMATRRVETPNGVAHFDHGAQFFTVRTSAFKAALAKAALAFAQWSEDNDPAGEARFVGTPGMSALPKALAEGLDVRLSTRIAALRRDEGGFLLETESGATLGPFATVIVATPAEQAGPLVLAHHAGFAAEAAAVRTAPCWAGLFAYHGSGPAAFSSRRLADHPVLAWIACDSAKPGREGGLSCWVAHARADWSAAHLELAPEDALALLQEAAAPFLAASGPLLVQQAHRWRFAQVETPAATPFAWDPALRLGVCGDWRLGPRIEAAWTSGHGLAQAVLS